MRRHEKQMAEVSLQLQCHKDDCIWSFKYFQEVLKCGVYRGTEYHTVAVDRGSISALDSVSSCHFRSWLYT